MVHARRALLMFYVFMSSRPRALLLLVLLLVDLVAVPGLLLLFLLVGGQRAVDDGGVVAEHLDREGVEPLCGEGVGDFFEFFGVDRDVDGFGGLASPDALVWRNV